MRYYNMKDNNKTILYLHGGPGDNCENFNCAAHYLSNEFNIVMIDQRGVLRSERIENNEKLSVMMIVDDCEYIRKKLGIDKWILIGHSFGGFVSLLYAHKYPKSVSNIIYENPSWSNKDAIKTINKNTAVYLRTLGEFALAERIDSSVNDCDDFAELIKLQMIVPEKYRMLVYYIKEWNEEVKQYCTLKNITDMQWENSRLHNKRIIADEINNTNCLPFLKEIKCPSLLIKGDHDPVVSKEFQDYFINNAYKSKLIIMNDCGHYAHTDDVQSFYNAVIDFLQVE